MVGTRSSERISRYLVLALILASVIASTLADYECRNSTKIGSKGRESEHKCQIEPKQFTIEVEGCKPLVKCINVCRGLCDPSYVYIGASQPFKSRRCDCCRPTLYSSFKGRRETLDCGGVKTVKKVFYPKIRSCDCGPCRIPS